MAALVSQRCGKSVGPFFFVRAHFFQQCPGQLAGFGERIGDGFRLVDQLVQFRHAIGQCRGFTVVAVEQEVAQVHAVEHDRLVDVRHLLVHVNDPLIAVLGALLVANGEPHGHRQQEDNAQDQAKAPIEFSGNGLVADVANTHVRTSTLPLLTGESRS